MKTINEPFQIPLAFFASASDKTLQDFELRQLDTVARINKEIEAMQDERNRCQAAADVARWLHTNRNEILATVGTHLENVRGSEWFAAAEKVSDAQNDPRSQPVADSPAPHSRVERRRSNVA